MFSQNTAFDLTECDYVINRRDHMMARVTPPTFSSAYCRTGIRWRWSVKVYDPEASELLWWFKKTKHTCRDTWKLTLARLAIKLELLTQERGRGHRLAGVFFLSCLALYNTTAWHLRDCTLYSHASWGFGLVNILSFYRQQRSRHTHTYGHTRTHPLTSWQMIKDRWSVTGTITASLSG